MTLSHWSLIPKLHVFLLHIGGKTRNSIWRGQFFLLNYFLFCTMNPFSWSSSAAFFIKQKFKLKWLLNPNSTRLAQTHNVVKIFQMALLIAGQTKPFYLKRFFVFLGVGNPAKDLNFANETHSAFKCTSSPQPCSEVLQPPVGQHRGPLAQPCWAADGSTATTESPALPACSGADVHLKLRS